MKNTFKIGLSILFLLTIYIPKLYSQEFMLNNQLSELLVTGTSSLHDWEEIAGKQRGHILVDLSKDLSIIQQLSIEITAESLKSGKGGMDKNTYKALKTSKYKSITFKLTEVKEIGALDADNYKVKTVGDLSLAGVTKSIGLDFNLNVSNSTVTLRGEKTFKMTDFNIQPPKALMGTITTGDEVTIKFKTVLNK